LIAVTEKLAPTVECLLHGNLPDSIDVGAGEVAETQKRNDVVLAQHSRSDSRSYGTSSLSTLRLTRIDVDRRGKRSLVNDMR